MPDDTLYLELAERARELIDKYGRELQVKSFVRSGADYNPVKTPTLNTVVGVVVPFRAREVDGELVRRHDKRIFVDCDQLIENDMRIVDKGVEYSIVEAELVEPGNISLLYKLQVRK